MGKRKLVCAICGEPVPAHEIALGQYLVEKVGWVQPRKRGGDHHFEFSHPTGRIMCWSCVIDRRHVPEPLFAVEQGSD